jgi:hypothetical protein
VFARDLVNHLIRLAWLGGIAWAALLIWFAATSRPLSAHEEGAIRHTLMLGFMAPLVLAFAHIILARFALGAIPHQKALTAGYMLILFAWPLRVGAGLFLEPQATLARTLLSTAGVATILGLGLAAFVAAATARGVANAVTAANAAFRSPARATHP